MKKSSLRALALTLGVAMVVGFGPGIVGVPLVATASSNNTTSSGSTASGNNTTDNTGSDSDTGSSSGSGSSVVANPLNPITSDDLVVETNWNTVLNDLNAALESSDRNVRILAGTQYTVPTDILSALVQKGKVLMLHAGNGLAISVSSEDVKAGTALKINMSKSVDIPQEACDKVANIAKTFAVKSDSVIPFKIDVHVTVGSKYAGKYAVLYRYQASTKYLVPVGTFVVTQGGNAMFALRSSGEYVVAISDELPKITATYSVVAGDSLSKIAKKYGVSLNALLQANPQIIDANKIKVGQELNVW